MIGTEDGVEALRRRLHAWVLHGAETERKDLEELFALSEAERVESGDCVGSLRMTGPVDGDGLLRLGCPEFHAKFREGDPLFLGASDRIELGLPVVFEGWDPEAGQVHLSLDRFERGDPAALHPGSAYRLDRRGLGLERLLLEGLDAVFHPENGHVLEALLGDGAEAPDAARHALGLARGRELGFTDAQCEALARGVATEACTLIHGPPGTGKTRVLAEIALFLAERRCRLFLSAFTHRAVDNVLATLRELSRDLPLYKVGRLDDDLRRLGVRPVRALERLALPPGGAIVAGTSFAARRFTKDRRFHFVLIDEAGQVPVVHGAIAMTQARRAILVGDPCQLPPVQKGGSFDAELEASIFAWLARRRPAVLLDRSFRMNAELCAPISAAYYGGRLEASGPSARRRLRLQPGGPLRELLDPEVPLVWARVDHLGRRRRSAEEARLVADLVQVLLHHHGLPPGELAVLTPFRTQIRQIRHELQRLDLWRPDLVVDTVERMQGQEREVVLISFAGSDRDDLARQAGFYFEPGRWNVSLTRARSKCILIGSRHALRARPRDLDQLLAVSRFKGIAARIPVVDLTSRYGGGSAFA